MISVRKGGLKTCLSVIEDAIDEPHVVEHGNDDAHIICPVGHENDRTAFNLRFPGIWGLWYQKHAFKHI